MQVTQRVAKAPKTRVDDSVQKGNEKHDGNGVESIQHSHRHLTATNVQIHALALKKEGGLHLKHDVYACIIWIITFRHLK